MPSIATARLNLIQLTPDFYEASLAGERERAERLLGLAIAPEWFAKRSLMRMRLDQLRADPSLAPWLLRAIALRAERCVIGHIGFHAAPGAPYLRERAQAASTLDLHTGARAAGGASAEYAEQVAPQEAYSPGLVGVEFGYAIYPAWRRQGYAREACLALMRWAAVEQGVSRFVLSISPGNLPSLRLAAQLGFTRIGSQMDDEDGPEEVFERRTTTGQTLLEEKP